MKRIIISVYIIFFSCNLIYSQSLNDYFLIAAENNSSLKASYKEYEAAIQKITQAKSLPDPQIGFGFYLSPNVSPFFQENLRISLSQALPWLGTLKAEGNAYALEADALFHNFINERNYLYFEVSKTYYQLVKIKQLIDIENSNLSLLNSYKSITKVKFENNEGTLVDILRVEMLIDEANLNIKLLNEEIEPVASTFNQLLNRDFNEEVIIDEKELKNEYDAQFDIENHPQIQSLSLLIEAEKQKSRAVKLSGMPQFSVGLDYEILQGQNNILMPMVSFSIPIFRKKYQGAIRQSELMQESFAYQKENFKNVVEAELKNLLFNINKQDNLLKLYDNQEQKSKTSLNLLYSGYSNDGEKFEEVLRMQQQLLDYQTKKIEASVELSTLIAELEYLLSKNSNYEEDK